MTHKSKLEVWHLVAIVYVVAVLALGGNAWIGVPVLVCLILMAFPHRYVTAPDALRVTAGLVRWTIPYRAITFVGALGTHIAVRVGNDPELLLSPADPAVFVAEVARYAPHVQVCL
ncbi:MAG TPA: hypothetical protein VMH28_31410 [Candidatus Acidoferrales bacterium]|nr:hypothetical protein [Candidatus Acidoferrales bacterium]